MEKNQSRKTLQMMLSMASPKALTKLILQLASESPDVRRECFEFLKSRKNVSRQMKSRSEGEIIMALWDELAPDLWELNEYGGGDYSLVDDVGDLLHEILTLLESKKIGKNYRDKILDRVLPFIEAGNAGLNDTLNDVAHAACYDDSDFRALAEAYELMQNEWETGLAREIYRRIGDWEKYLELRQQKMKYGADYHDLATFYRDTGEKEKALKVAEDGLVQGQGRMDELRSFLSHHAKQTGNREKYLSLEFAQTTDHLTHGKYMAFKRICSKEEWDLFEPELVKQLEKAQNFQVLKIRMERKEFPEALTVLLAIGYPISIWDGGDVIKISEKLEKRYPEEILTFYLSGLGSLKSNATRKEYSRRAGVMVKVRHMIVDVLKDDSRWVSFGKKVKFDNIRRPAFQQEFANKVSGWLDL